MTDEDKGIIEALFPGVALTQDQIAGVLRLVRQDAMVVREANIHLINKVIPEVLPTLSEGNKFGLIGRISGALRIPMMQTTSAANAVHWEFFTGERTGDPIFRATSGATTLYFEEPRPRWTVTRPAKFNAKMEKTENEVTQYCPVAEKDIQFALDGVRVGKSRPSAEMLRDAERIWRQRAGL
jgi:hypothetical protein